MPKLQFLKETTTYMSSDTKKCLEVGILRKLDCLMYHEEAIHNIRNQISRDYGLLSKELNRLDNENIKKKLLELITNPIEKQMIQKIDDIELIKQIYQQRRTK